MNNEQLPLAMSESFWANSHLSIARYTGRIHLGKYDYVICNKDGKDIFECSRDAERAGREKAIEPGEPCDLCRVDFVPIYRKLGREQFLKFIQENPDVYSVKKAKERLKQWQQKPND